MSAHNWSWALITGHERLWLVRSAYNWSFVSFEISLFKISCQARAFARCSNKTKIRKCIFKSWWKKKISCRATVLVLQKINVVLLMMFLHQERNRFFFIVFSCSWLNRVRMKTSTSNFAHIFFPLIFFRRRSVHLMGVTRPRNVRGRPFFDYIYICLCKHMYTDYTYKCNSY